MVRCNWDIAATRGKTEIWNVEVESSNNRAQNKVLQETCSSKKESGANTIRNVKFWLILSSPGATVTLLQPVQTRPGRARTSRRSSRATPASSGSASSSGSSVASMSLSSSDQLSSPSSLIEMRRGEVRCECVSPVFVSKLSLLNFHLYFAPNLTYVSVK